MVKAKAMKDVPDSKSHIFIKLDNQHKRGQKSFNYNGPTIIYPVEVVFEVYDKEGEQKGIIKYDMLMNPDPTERL